MEYVLTATTVNSLRLSDWVAGTDASQVLATAAGRLGAWKENATASGHRGRLAPGRAARVLGRL